MHYVKRNSWVSCRRKIWFPNFFICIYFKFIVISLFFWSMSSFWCSLLLVWASKWIEYWIYQRILNLSNACSLTSFEIIPFLLLNLFASANEHKMYQLLNYKLFQKPYIIQRGASSLVRGDPVRRADTAASSESCQPNWNSSRGLHCCKIVDPGFGLVAGAAGAPWACRAYSGAGPTLLGPHHSGYLSQLWLWMKKSASLPFWLAVQRGGDCDVPGWIAAPLSGSKLRSYRFVPCGG